MDRYQPFMTAPSLAPALLWKPPYIIVCHSDYGCQLNATVALPCALLEISALRGSKLHTSAKVLGSRRYICERDNILFRLLKPLSVRIRAVWFLSCQKRSLGDLIRSRSLHYN